LEKAIVIDPKFDRAFMQLGNLRLSRGDLRQAVADYQKAIEIDPAAAEAHYRLGLAYRRIGDEAKAQSEIETYKNLDQASAAQVERQRRELGQFLFVFKEENLPQTPPTIPHQK
jgi:Flp pilus assembly protein TadD